MNRLPAALCLLMSLAAAAAGQLDAVRSTAAHARELTNQVREEQAGQRAALNQLAGRIEALKQQAKGKLLPGSELDAALKRSQDLSAQLTGLATALVAREGEQETANLALLTELSGELARVRSEFDRQTDRATRQRLIDSMRRLRTEREQVRAMLPTARLPALEAPRPSDDPEDLLEQADALKDNEDKVRAQLQSLDQRIAEARQEKELDGRVRQFLGEESLFDDQDRRLRVHRETVQAAGTASAPAAPTTFQQGGETPSKSADFTSATDTAGRANPVPLPLPTNSTGIQGGPTGAFDARPETPQVPAAGTGSSAVREVQGTDARPQVGGHRIAGSDDDDLEDLEIQRSRLKGLADELRSRATKLQKRAAELK